MNKRFQFKQFSLAQDQCAMKIGTDGILLGAWTDIPTHIHNVLDVGAGTGLLSCMIAQRHNSAHIDAIEIDAGGYQQCRDNIKESPYSERIHVIKDDFRAHDFLHRYDLIVSNPPFYNGGVYDDSSRKRARSNDSLPLDSFLKQCLSLIHI